jgi:hypothetical protein
MLGVPGDAAHSATPIVRPVLSFERSEGRWYRVVPNRG